MRCKDFFLNKSKFSQPQRTEGSVTWACPSNIELIKDWSKYGELLPNNPSLSITLTNVYTETGIDYTISDKPSVKYILDGIYQPEMTQLITEYIKKLYPYFSYLPVLKLVIHSYNSFPQFSGTIISPSEVGSLALALCSIEEELTGQKTDSEFFFRKASFIARLGSGCAARSIYGGSVLWGLLPEINKSSELYGAQLGPLPFLEDLNVATLIVSNSNKPDTPLIQYFKLQFYNLASCRYEHAKMHILRLLEIAKRKDYLAFCELIENEALLLHRMVLSSSVYGLSLYPETLNIISKVRSFRKKSGVPFCFTIDAAPNIHLLYPNQFREIVIYFIRNTLLPSCEVQQWIDDKVGIGPVIIDKNFNYCNDQIILQDNF
jgi:diphosphomevalonate decarboxylase